VWGIYLGLWLMGLLAHKLCKQCTCFINHILILPQVTKVIDDISCANFMAKDLVRANLKGEKSFGK
jgi:hypothetical protein